MAEENGEDLRELIDRSLSLELDIHEKVPACVENAIPPGMDRKPFWARGLDVLTYGFLAFRHVILLLENVVNNNGKSCIILAELGESATL